MLPARQKMRLWLEQMDLNDRLVYTVEKCYRAIPAIASNHQILYYSYVEKIILHVEGKKQRKQ